ncbi:hypothetical protein P3T76_007027 [Phytophthora citrophthora]|uniref:Uncharacterized protein n=1 Tax=Phytophthora citrophthora TaxID=4793 RepID=A0AAD9GNK6_9STRA|nr:hypothetical protein P3T76_007027 [Phytophthora citrophthora]
MVPAGRGWPQSRQKAAVESPNGIRHLAHDVIGICNVPLGATVDREYAELADAPDKDTPDCEIDDLEKPRFSEPLDFFEYSEVGVGFGVETADGFE